MMNVAIILFGFFHLTTSHSNQPTNAPSNMLNNSSSNFALLIEADLHEIESLKKEVFKNIPLNDTKNKKDSPFGLLDEDWERLYKLEEMLPKESKLKTKLVKAFRLLILALNQAYSKPVFQTGDDHGSLIITSTNNASTLEKNLSDQAFNNKSKTEDHDGDDDDDYEGAGSDKQETELIFSLPPNRADPTILPVGTTKLIVNFNRSISTDITTQKIFLSPNFNISHRNTSETDMLSYVTTTTDIQETDFDEEMVNNISALTGKLDKNGVSQVVTSPSYINANSTPFKHFFSSNPSHSFDTQPMHEEFTPDANKMSMENETTEQNLFPDVPSVKSTLSISSGKMFTPFVTLIPTTLSEDKDFTGNVDHGATYYNSDKNVIHVIMTNTTTESTENPTLNVNQSTTNLSVSKSVTPLVASVPSADLTEDPTRNVEQSTLTVPGGKNLTPYVTTLPTTYLPEASTVNMYQTTSSIGHSKSSTPLTPSITTTDLPEIFTGNVDPDGSNISNENSLDSSTVKVTTLNKYYDSNNDSKYTTILNEISTANYNQHSSSTQEASDQNTRNQVVIPSTALEIFEPTFTTTETEHVKENSYIVTSSASIKFERIKDESEGKNNTNNPTTEMTPKEETNTTSTTKSHRGPYPSYFDNDLYEEGFSKDGFEKGKDFPDSIHEEGLPENKGGFESLGDEEKSSAKTKESFKYFTVQFKKILEKHDPDIRRNRLGIYQKKLLPVINPYQKSLSTCRNKNGCVQVQKYQHQTPFYETSKLQTSKDVPKHIGKPYKMVSRRGDIDLNTDVLTRSKRNIFNQNLLKS